VKRRDRFRTIAVLCIGVPLVVTFLVWGGERLDVVSAREPEERPAQGRGGVIGVASTALDCLATGGDLPASASGTVHLTWQGQPERARLVVNVAGSEAPHSIKVNGQVAASVPVRPA
jgi:hypothetical protein